MTFPLFRSHLDLAHQYWKQLLTREDIAIDATCGNGQDTIVLARLARIVYAMDIQEQAIQETKKRAEEILVERQEDTVRFVHGSHETFPEEIQQESVKLVVYNLGYLPGGDKTITTETSSTLKSLEQAMVLLLPGGCLSITCYPGHSKGLTEELAVLEFVSGLDPKKWSSMHHQRLDRRQAPSLTLVQKKRSLQCPGITLP